MRWCREPRLRRRSCGGRSLVGVNSGRCRRVPSRYLVPDPAAAHEAPVLPRSRAAPAARAAPSCPVVRGAAGREGGLAAPTRPGRIRGWPGRPAREPEPPSTACGDAARGGFAPRAGPGWRPRPTMIRVVSRPCRDARISVPTLRARQRPGRRPDASGHSSHPIASSEPRPR